MSNSLKSLMAIYEVKTIRPSKRPKNPTRRVRSIIQSSSAQNLGLRANKILRKPRQNNLSVEPHVRHQSQDKALQKAARQILNRSLDEDMEKLENLTVRNISARKDWLNVQERIVAMQVHKQLNTIKESDEYAPDYYPENIYTNPVDVLVQKYASHKKNNSYAEFPY